MNQSHDLSYHESLFLSYKKVPKVKISCSYSKHLGISALTGKALKAMMILPLKNIFHSVNTQLILKISLFITNNNDF